jgi:hypothetical protein
MPDKIVIKISEINFLAQEGSKLVFKKEANDALKKLLEIQALVNQKVDEVAKAIEEAGLAIDPSFKGVIGEDVKCIYREYGDKYGYHLNDIPQIQDFLKEVSYYRVNAPMVDDYLKKVKELPQGIIVKTRTKKLSPLLIKKSLPDGEI